MRIERCYDLEVINYVLNHPKIKQFVNDDFSGDVEYKLLDNLYYLAAYENDIIAGMFVVFPLNAITLDSHNAILPEFYGDKAREAGIKTIAWIFNNTEYLKINGSTPFYNKLALKFAEDIGFEKEGVNKKSFMRNGKLHDQVYFGLEREKWQSERQF